MNICPYHLPRIQEPRQHVLALDAPALWALFAAHRTVVRALQGDEMEINVEEYRDCAGWIGGLWSRPLLAAPCELISETQIKRCEAMLSRLPADSPVRSVVVEARRLRANQKVIALIARRLCEEVALSLGDEVSVIATENDRSRVTLDTIDEIRSVLGMPALQRFRTWPKTIAESGVALLFGAPRFDRPQFRWAFWPPVAPKVLQVVWKPLVSYASPIANGLDGADSPWEYQRSEGVVSLRDLSEPVEQGVSAPNEELALDLADGWHQLRASKSAQRLDEVTRERVFRRRGSMVCVSDRRNGSAPASPFLIASDPQGFVSSSDEPPAEEGALWILARPTGAESMGERQRLHQFVELVDFKRQLKNLSVADRANVVQEIARQRLMRKESAEANFTKWCSSRPEDPYLPQSDQVFEILAKAVRLTPRRARDLRKKVSDQVGLHRSVGHAEARAWRHGAECGRLDDVSMQLLRGGDEAEILVELSEATVGILSLVALDSEVGCEWQE